MSDPKNDAVDAYKRRSALFFEVLAIGTPDENEAQLLRDAHRIVGRAIEGEVFNREPEGLEDDDGA